MVIVGALVHTHWIDIFVILHSVRVTSWTDGAVVQVPPLKVIFGFAI